MCPQGIGHEEARDGGLWLDETKATCYANKLDYLDQRPDEEQEQLTNEHELGVAHGTLRASQTREEIEITHIRKVWAYVMTGAGIIVAGFIGERIGERIGK